MKFHFCAKNFILKLLLGIINVNLSQYDMSYKKIRQYFRGFQICLF